MDKVQKALEAYQSGQIVMGEFLAILMQFLAEGA